MATHTEEYPNRVFKSPLDYFEPDRELAEGALTQPVIYTSSGSVGIGASLMFNYANSRPLMSGIHRHIGMTAGSLFCGYLFYKWRQSVLADRDAAIRHYIQSHPDDFPPIERRQYKDIFEPWIPRR